MDKINILYAGNDKVFDGILTSALSAVMRLDAPTELEIHILTMDLTRANPKYTPMNDTHARAICEALKRHNPSTRVILHDVTEIYERELAFNANEGCYCSPYTLLRLLADMIDLPEKILYLDADVLFNKSPRLIFNIDVGEYEYAAANDHYGKFLINPRYINAGVILFNMRMCGATGLFKKARELIRVRKLVFADQSAIIRSTTRKKLISQRFNDQKFLYKNTVIRHFSKRLFYLPYPHTDNIKQWHIHKLHKVFGYSQFDDVLFEYIYTKKKIEYEVEQ